jgi:hypothetical protein
MRLEDMDQEKLGDLVREGITSRADSLGLDDSRLSVTPILNWGGFVNRSFKVTDGRVAYHVKLATEPETLSGLERWRSLDERLSRDYHAPAMRGWLDLPNVAGPIFQWIDGATPNRLAEGPLAEVSAVISRLHLDADLAADLLRWGDPAGTCAEAYASTYHERFIEDLELIRTAPPPFIGAHGVDWMDREAQDLREMVQASAAFQEPAGAPTHGDPWLDNLLVTPERAWYLLDWDGLALGDPVMDWTMLLGPTRSDPRPITDARAARIPLADEERGRIPLYARASLLDWIIDPLADWVEAEHEPMHGNVIRESNRRVHEQARAAYRKIYG